MNEQIEKIDDIDFTITEEVIQRKWIEVYNKRHKLLSMSDWSQLLDNDLPQNVRNHWRTWRKKVREIKKRNGFSVETALDALNKLEAVIPDNSDYKTDTSVKEFDYETYIKEYADKALNNIILPKLISVNDIENIIKDRLNQHFSKLEKSFESYVNNYVNEFFNTKFPEIKLDDDLQKAKIQLINLSNEYFLNKIPKFNNDLFDDALEYKLDKSLNKLLKLYSTKKVISLENAVSEIIDNKKKNYNLTCELYEKLLNLHSRINLALDKSELFDILQELE